MRVAMTHAAHANSGNKVDILLAVFVGNDLVASPRQGNPGIEGNTLEAGRDILLLFGKDLCRFRGVPSLMFRMNLRVPPTPSSSWGLTPQDGKFS